MPIKVDDPPPDWTLLRSFVEVVRTGSLTAAARTLGTTQPTVGRHVRQLEEMSGDILFDRRDSRLEPTERALELFPWAERIASEVTALGRAFALPVAEIAGPVRITTSETFAVHVLPDILMPLLEDHPGLSVEIVSSDDVQDLVRRDADLAIRFVRPQQPNLIARRVGAVEIGLYATIGLLDRMGHPRDPTNLSRYRIIGSASGEEIDAFIAAHGIARAPGTSNLRADSLLVRMAAVRAGLGVGPMHCWLADRDDGLERVLPELTVRTLPIWMVAHSDLARSQRFRVTFDHLAEALSAQFNKADAR